MGELDVAIKSVQQHERSANQIQVGTIVPASGQLAFAISAPLNVDKLATLSGDEFWKTAFNGQAWCDRGIEATVPCTISQQGTPVFGSAH